jgi:hypothetical protein
MPGACTSASSLMRPRVVVKNRPDDSELILEALRHPRFPYPCCRSIKTERACLAPFTPDLDLVPADHPQPQFGRRQPRTPLTGTQGSILRPPAPPPSTCRCPC